MARVPMNTPADRAAASSAATATATAAADTAATAATTTTTTATATATVAALAISPVKAMRFINVDTVALDRAGAAGDRSFYVIDDRARMVNGKRFGGLQAIVPEYHAGSDELALVFPDGRRITGTVGYGEPVATRFHSRPRQARLVDGPWAQALSEFFGHSLRLVEDGNAIDRGRKASVSLMSRASLRRLAQELGADTVDGRRFRMMIEIDGVPAHEEDRWVGRRVRIGPALVAMHGHIGRCMVTTRNPDDGEVDLKTLHALAVYRGEEESVEALPFGIYGEVVEGGPVRVGDPVELR